MPPEYPIPALPDAFDAADALRRYLHDVARSTFTVGVGLKQTGGDFTDRIAVFVYVAKKRPLAEIPEAERIPPEFGGHPTDVVEHQMILAADVTRYDPLRGGIQISRPADPDDHVHEGTLGAIVRSRVDDRLLLLTCAHIVRVPGTRIFQPALGEIGASVIGTAVLFRDEGSPLLLDCAAVTNDSSRRLRMSVQDVGPVRGVVTTVPDLWSPVKKRGERTLLTTGRVTRLASGSVPAVSAIEVTSDPPSRVFAGGGDSGSVLLDANDRVIGLLFGIPNEDMGPRLSSGGLAMPIHTVQESLQVDIAMEPIF